ncbi:MAG: HDOD domain-containing protein [Proteobacteria bacterium]|nr:HDOD domain-containing protein [Pseudomonadota bacterium]
MQFSGKTCKTCGFNFDSTSALFRSSKRFRLCNSGHLWVNCRCDSTLLFRNALKEPWFSESLSQTSSNAQKFFAALKSPEHLPMPSSEIIKLIDTIDLIKEIAELAKAINVDKNIAQKLIITASLISKAKAGAPIDAIDHAIAYMGINSGKEIIKTFLLKSTIPASAVSQEFWIKAESTASIAAHLAAFINFPQESWGKIYVAAKFANIGKMVLYVTNLDSFKKITELSSTKALAYREAEKQSQATPHEALSELALCLWGHKQDIIKMAGEHHRDPLGLPPRSSIEDWEIVALANQLAHWRHLEPHLIDEKYMLRLLRRFDISSDAAEAIVLGKK